jgi:hypothetical protein
MQLHALGDELRGLPVDGEDDLQGQQWVGEESQSQRGIGELAPDAAERCGDDRRPVRPATQDRRRHALARRGQAEVVSHVQAHERRDEERLGAAAMAEAVTRPGGGLHQVDVPLAEGVVDLHHRRRQFAGGAMTEKDADRVEDVAQHARQAEQPNRAAGDIDAGRRQHRLDLGPERPVVARQVVALMQAEDREAAQPEQVQTPVQRRQLVQVDEQLEQPVAEPVAARRQPLMDHRAIVEAADQAAQATRPSIGAGAGVGPRKMRPDSFATDQGRRTPPSASATARPACRPSSWKPAPK